MDILKIIPMVNFNQIIILICTGVLTASFVSLRDRQRKIYDTVTKIHNILINRQEMNLLEMISHEDLREQD